MDLSSVILPDDDDEGEPVVADDDDDATAVEPVDVTDEDEWISQVFLQLITVIRQLNTCFCPDQ